MRKTVVTWINRYGEHRRHTLFGVSKEYAKDWWRTSIEESQGPMTVAEKKESKLQLLDIYFEE